jgi:hypothetical protein
MRALDSTTLECLIETEGVSRLPLPTQININMSRVDYLSGGVRARRCCWKRLANNILAGDLILQFDIQL